MQIVRLASTATALTMNVNGSSKNIIEPCILADLIKKGLETASFGKLVIVDCRKFFDYNTSHIKNAVNVCCSKLIRKRLQENKLSILDILRPSIVEAGVELDALDCDKNTKQSPEALDVVLYADQNGVATNQPPRPNQCCGRKCADEVSFLAMLMEKMSATAKFHSVKMLSGGFVDFQSRYPELCEGALGGMGSPASGRSSTSGLGSASRLTLASLSQPCLPVSGQGPTKILPFLYLGSQQDAMDQETLSKYGIDYILNMSVGCPKPDFVQDEHFMRIAVNDSHSEKLLPYFERAFEFLDKVKEANSRVLVHCLAGISRSPTLAIAFVMRHLNLSQEEAYSYVKKRRPAISPNFNFLGQLLEYERQLKTSRQSERQQLDHASVNISPLSATELPTSRANPKAAMLSADNDALTKQNLFLDLQKANCSAKVPVTQCSSSKELAAISELSMKRSSSCPVKIQKSAVGIGSGPMRDALNLDFEFSPATMTNVNGKRQMIPSMIFGRASDEFSIPCGLGKEIPTSDDSLKHRFDEASKLKDFIGRFDKVQTDRFLRSDYFSKPTSISKGNFGMKPMKPLHEELPSPSTELSKLNFDGGSVCETLGMDISEPPLSFASNIPSWCQPIRCPATKVQVWSDSTSISTTNVLSSKLPSVSTGMAGRCDAGDFFTTAPSFSVCATNPFFASPMAIGGCDGVNSRSKFGFKSTLWTRSDGFSRPDSTGPFEPVSHESTTIVEENFDEPMNAAVDSGIDLHARVEDFEKDEHSMAGGNSISASNPLFQTTLRGSFKRKSQRRMSLCEKTGDRLDSCPATAPILVSTEKPAKMRSVRSESQLQHAATVRQKLANARTLIVSSFSRKISHFLNKRASWPHAVPYLAGIPVSGTEASGLWALAPQSTKESSGSNVPLFQETSTDQAISKPEIVHGCSYGGPSFETKAENPRANPSMLDPSLLAPQFDMDSPESGFVESPTISNQRESTSSSTAVAPNVFLHRDPERDSLGSSSSLEIAVS